MITINCDMGEGAGHDAAVMPFIDLASIACGYHAGDEATMRETLYLAKKHGVKAGAHPSFPDRGNFGRTEMQVPSPSLFEMVVEQMRTLQKLAAASGIPLFHVKPHGALYNMAAKDPALAHLIAAAVETVDENLVLVGLSGSCLIAAGKAAGLQTAAEVFADRRYRDDGSLTPRSQEGALITNEKEAVAQVLQIARENRVTALSGKQIPVVGETVCIHGDGQDPAGFARAIAEALRSQQQAGTY